jgi:hypothetical protein
MLIGGIGFVMMATRLLQLVQTNVLRTLPFGSLSNFSLVDVCVGVLVSGLFMLYLGESLVLALCFVVFVVVHSMRGVFVGRQQSCGQRRVLLRFACVQPPSLLPYSGAAVDFGAVQVRGPWCGSCAGVRAHRTV